MVELQSLNLSKNFIRVIENLSHMPNLETLTLGNNSIGPEAACIEHVLELPKLQSLDLQANKLDDGEGVIDILSRMDDLCAFLGRRTRTDAPVTFDVPRRRVVYLQGNPFMKTLRNYRKRVIAACRQLRYLDDRPVFDDERRRVNAWGAAMERSGGNLDEANAAEREEIVKIREEKKEEEDKRIRDFDQMISNAKAEAAAERSRNGGEDLGVSFSGAPIIDPSRPPTFVDPDELD